MSQLNNTTFRTCFPLFLVLEGNKKLRRRLGQPSRSDFVQFLFGEETPSEPEEETPSDPGEETPSDPSEETPSEPSQPQWYPQPEPEVIIPVWEPTTPDELKRFAVLGREKVKYTTDPLSAYPVLIVNDVQGTLCFDVFEIVAMDYTIGRTYNIFPNEKPVYEMDQKVKITLEIPELLRAENREFKMICVSEGGMPYVYEDMDTDADTITFETDKFYAYALIYKDQVQ